MMVSVNVGFLYMVNFQLVGVLWMVMSRKFIWLFVSCSAVNFSFGCIVFKSSMMLWTSIDDQYVIYISEVSYNLVFV
jgi:hypothetical protein